jgi:hypothetical protein
VPDFSADLSLLFFCSINIAVFASAWLFASRCMTRSRSQAFLDAALLGYLVQYAAVGLPGLTHCLRPINITAVAMVFVVAFLVAAWKAKQVIYPATKKLDRMTVAGIAIFAIGFLAMFVRSQADLPVISNDAMTYHFPAAVQWLQQGRISLFQTWFFNPANTYSPLAGSMFIVWMIAPFGSDVMARFVEVPTLLCVGIAMYRLCREVGVRITVAALVAGAAVLSRPIFTPSMMGKDDLFVAFFFIATIVAMSPARSGERWGFARFGIALGLLLATKYTAILTLPILLFAIDGPYTRPGARRISPSPGTPGEGRGEGDSERKTILEIPNHPHPDPLPEYREREQGRFYYLFGLTIAILIAGPWYLRNLLLTGNPLFPMFSQFITSRTDSFHSWQSAIAVVVGSAYALPALPATVLGVGWIFAMPWAWKRPIPRACVLGIIPTLVLFFWKSPFPEVRFVLPVFLLLFASAAIAIQHICTTERAAISAAAVVFGTSLGTVFAWQAFSTILVFSAVALLLAMIGLVAINYAKANRFRWLVIIAIFVGLCCQYTYVHWTAYCRDYRESLFDTGSGYDVEYPQLNRLWRFANKNLPADATIAYTNMYLIYPLENDSMKRKLVYVPTRPDVKTIADLGWIGNDLSGEQLVPAAVRTTIASPNCAVWLQNLKSVGAKYLIIGKGGSIKVPPEAEFAVSDPSHFHSVYNGPAGSIYQVR